MRKILFSLFTLLFVGLGFCSANVITFSNGGGGSVASNSTFTINPNSCVLFTNPTCTNKAKFLDTNNNEITATKSTYALICNTYNTNITYQNTHTSSCSTYYYSGLLTNIQDLKTCPTCPDQYSSLECQTEYNLIPISSVDQNYCVNNNLCPSSGGGDCGTGDSNWSALYINDIQHLGKPIINITIPEEIDWDYINTGDSFDLDVVGYNVNYEAMSETLSVQKYRPTSEDFTKVVSILAPYMKILLFLLFAYIVIKRLKKPFSSKLK